MKIRILIIALTFSIPFLANAQQPGQGQLSDDSRERIEAQRIGFITTKLNLTPDEATKFWPIYNQHRDAVKDLRDDIERPDLMNISDEEASATIQRHLQLEEKRLDLKKELYTRLRPVIGPKKILMLHAAEREFNRQLLNKWTVTLPNGFTAKKLPKDKFSKEK